MKKTDFSKSKVEGPGKIVQIDEIVFNFKCKILCGRSPNNKTNDLVIVEKVNHVERVFACIIRIQSSRKPCE